MKNLLACVPLVLLVGIASAETKEPAYQVVDDTPVGYEIRQYDEVVVATVEVRGSHQQAMSRGFRTLANFIFGGNETGTSIAMTAPVIQMETTTGEVADKDRRFAVTFVMPEDFTLDTVPAPNKKEIEITTLPPQRYAVIQFPGRGTEENFATHRAALEAALARDGVSTVGAPLNAQYDEPWIPASKRRNEIMWPLATSPEAAAPVVGK